MRINTNKFKPKYTYRTIVGLFTTSQSSRLSFKYCYGLPFIFIQGLVINVYTKYNKKRAVKRKGLN
jgi:hypothetical protein